MVIGCRMSLLSESWPRCPQHFTWMQPLLRPRQWHCNVLEHRSHSAEASRVAEGLDGFADPSKPKWDEVVEIDDGMAMCRETERYRWWRSLDRRVFAILEVNESSGMYHYYCPLCEGFFSPDGTLETKYGSPYFRLCQKCLKMGTENEEESLLEK